MLYEELKNKQVHIPEGIRKIFEAVIKDGRSLVINDLDLNSDLVPDGTLFIDSATSKMKVKKHNYVESILPTDIFDPEVLTDVVVQKNAINGNRIRQRTVTRDRIQTETLTGNEIENGSVPGAKITFNTIENRHIRSNSIETHQIVNDAVTGDKIAPLNIDQDHITSDAIRSRHLKAANVLEDHLGSESVTSSKIKFSNVLSSHIRDKNILSHHIGDDQVNDEHILDGSIISSKLGDASVTTNKIQNQAVNTSKIALGSIFTQLIAENQVTFNKLDTEVRNRIYRSLDVIGGVGTLPNLHATEKVVTKTLDASELTKTKDIIASGDVKVSGTLHVKGDITTDSKVYRVAFNDIAEAYIPGEPLEPGDVVQIEEDGNIYKSDFMSDTVVGIISDCYGDCFGASAKEIEDGSKVPVGLIGKVPVKVLGPIKIGTKIIAGDDGVAYPVLDGNVRDAIGKAIESSDHAGIKRVLCLIYPN